MSERGVTEAFESGLTQFEQDRQRLSDMNTEPAVDLYAQFRDEGAVPGVPHPTANEDDTLMYGYQESMRTQPMFNPTTPSDEYFEDMEDEYVIDKEDEVIFDGGPKVSQVLLWKAMYEKEGNRVIMVRAADDFFVFRTLNRYEYKTLISIPNSDAITREEMICKHCVLWPSYSYQNMALGRGGVPSTLAQAIMEASGFTKNYEVRVL